MTFILLSHTHTQPDTGFIFSMLPMRHICSARCTRHDNTYRLMWCECGIICCVCVCARHATRPIRKIICSWACDILKHNYPRSRSHAYTRAHGVHWYAVVWHMHGTYAHKHILAHKHTLTHTHRLISMNGVRWGFVLRIQSVRLVRECERACTRGYQCRCMCYKCIMYVCTGTRVVRLLLLEHFIVAFWRIYFTIKDNQTGNINWWMEPVA